MNASISAALMLNAHSSLPGDLTANAQRMIAACALKPNSTPVITASARDASRRQAMNTASNME